jgi:hypothetical protein
MLPLHQLMITNFVIQDKIKNTTDREGAETT